MQTFSSDLDRAFDQLKTELKVYIRQEVQRSLLLANAPKQPKINLYQELSDLASYSTTAKNDEDPLTDLQALAQKTNKQPIDVDWDALLSASKFRDRQSQMEAELQKLRDMLPYTPTPVSSPKLSFARTLLQRIRNKS